MAYIYNLTDTWNAAGTVFTAISMDVTNTASAAGSKVISLKVNGTELLGLDKTGKLGIGISDPASKFHVAGTGDTRITVGNASAAIQFGVESTGPCFITNNASQPLYFMTNSVERMRITASGGLAVGTDSVRGGVVQINGQTSNTNGTGLDQGQLLITDTDNPNDSGLMIGYRFDPMVDEYGRLQARNSLGPVAIAIQPGGGRVGIGISGVNQSAVLEVASTTMGFLPPRMTTVQRDAISSPANGLVLYNSSTNKLQVRAAGAWVDLH